MQAFPSLRTLFSGSKSANIADTKQTLLDAIAPLQRGLSSTPSDVERIESLVVELEGRNPTAAPVTSPKLNGEWELLYTTSDSILGRSRPSFLRPKGPIYQTLDNETLRGKNRETTPLFNAVEAELEPLSDSEVAVQFVRFWLAGFIPVPAPASARGRLDTTYLDDDLRISRGDKGSLFVLRMNDKAFMYVLVPMPALFFGGAPGSNLASSWVDAGKFLTGFSAVGSVAIPAILYHAGKIVGGALVMQLVAVGVLASTLFAWDYLSESDEGGFYSY